MGEKLFPPKTEEAKVQELFCKALWRQTYSSLHENMGKERIITVILKRKKQDVLLDFPGVFIVILSQFSSELVSATFWNKMSSRHK